MFFLFILSFFVIFFTKISTLVVYIVILESVAQALQAQNRPYGTIALFKHILQLKQLFYLIKSTRIDSSERFFLAGQTNFFLNEYLWINATLYKLNACENMGGSNDRQIRVCTLNYSGNLQSPFQFYGQQNWNQLEDIGKLFQAKLRYHYNQIRDTFIKKVGGSADNSMKVGSWKELSQKEKQIKKELGQVPSMPPKYSRRQFKWHIGNIYSLVHERYTPLVAKQQQIEGEEEYCGVRNNGKFETFDTFRGKWATEYDKIRQKEYRDKDLKAYNEALLTKDRFKFRQYHCMVMDFLAYDSILHYLYNQQQRKEIQAAQSWEGNKEPRYFTKEVPAHQYISYLIDQNEFESTQQVTKILLDKYRYYLDGIFNKKFNGQVRIKYKRKMTQDYLFKFNKHDIVFLQGTRYAMRDILDSIDDYVMRTAPLEKATVIMLRADLPFLHDPKNDITSEFDNKLQDYLYHKVVAYIEFTQERLKQHTNPIDDEKVMKYLQEIRSYRLFWLQKCAFAVYRYQGRNIFICNVDFEEDPIYYNIQIQMLGMLLVYLIKQIKCSYIIGGNFSHFPMYKQKDKNRGIFDFVNKKPQLFGLTAEQVLRLPDEINRYPRHYKINTTRNKRTILQGNMKRTNQLEEHSEDQFFTNFEINDKGCFIGVLKEINSTGHNPNSLIPNDDHLFQNYAVKVALKGALPRNN